MDRNELKQLIQDQVDHVLESSEIGERLATIEARLLHVEQAIEGLLKSAPNNRIHSAPESNNPESMHTG